MIFAYTVKGYGLATEGHPQNHSALLTAQQLTDLAARTGADPEHPWRGFADGTPEAALCAATAQRLRREPVRGASRRRYPLIWAAPRPAWPPPKRRWAGPCWT